MPDLGAYTVEVTLSYAGSILILLVLLGVSMVQSRRAARALEDAERRIKDA